MVSNARPAFNFLAQVDRARIWAAGGQREEALASLPAARSALQSRQSVLLAEADELEARLRLSLGDPLGARRAAERLPFPRRAVVDAIIALAEDDDTTAEDALSVPGRCQVDRPLGRGGCSSSMRTSRSSHAGQRRRVSSGRRSTPRSGTASSKPCWTRPRCSSRTSSRGPHLYPEPANLGPLLSAYHDAHDVQAMAGARPRQTGVVEPLTEMEIRVLARLADHLSYRDIASDLYVSINTVKTHVKHIYFKLGVSSRSSAISRAATLGLLGDDPPAKLDAGTPTTPGRQTNVAPARGSASSCSADKR